jgi:hypothetical protein
MENKSTVYPVRLSVVLLKKAQLQAKKEQRTLASLIRMLLDQHTSR